jgi:glycosyltransferase involved in cell wall biosynthesis
MLNNKKIVVIMPAYNAEKTLVKTYKDIPMDIVDQVILVDDHSNDNTLECAGNLDLKIYSHDQNLGYGANQKTCYINALREGADIIVMLHPDYQYPPKFVTAMAALLCTGEFDMILGSRVLCGMALKNGMPWYKYISNRFLTFLENLMLNYKLSEYHTGYRAFTREVLLELPVLENSDDFIFDNQIIAQAIYFGYRIGEISAPCRYNKDSSSINFRRSVFYGLGVIWTGIKFVLQKSKLAHFKIFDKNGKKILL